MSDIVSSGSTESASSTATSSSSAPTSTADIAASVISDMDSGEGDQAPVAAQPAQTSQQPPVDPDDFDAVEAERVDALGRKRENAIPHSRVKQMIAKKEAAKERALIAQVAKELGITKAEAELKLDDVVGGIKERGSKLTEFERRIQTVSAVEEVMANDPARFMEMLGSLNPEYKQFVRQQVQQAAQAQAAAAAGDDDPEPQPDFDLGNGQRTYSLDGLRKLRAWERRQAVKEVEGNLDKRLKPVEERIQSEQQRAQLEQRRQQFIGQLQQKLDRARKWPQFKESENDIMAALKADRALSLEDAYMQVVVPKLAGDRTKIRQEVLDEINSQPKTTSTPNTASSPKQSDKPKTTADIAREVMAQLGNQ